MERKYLKDGNWLDVRERGEVTVRGRRGIQAISLGLKDLLTDLPTNGEGKVMVNVTDLDLTEDQADAMLRLQEATIVALVAGWSYPEPVPTMATVGDLPSELFDEIAELTKGVGAEVALDTRATLDPDPKDLSGSSELSDGLSRVEQESSSTPSW